MAAETSTSGPAASPPAKPWRYTAVLVMVSLACYCFCYFVPDLMTLAGVSHHGVWFLDTYAILAALDAQRAGLDPYAYNPLNYFGGPHVYSHWWLWLGQTGLSRADSVWVGAMISCLAVVTAWWILRPGNRRELGYSIIVLCSAPFVLGLNRANADLLLFVLLSWCVPCLLSRHRFWRVAGTPLLITLGLGLKYYPAVAGLVLLAVRPAADRRRAIGLLAVLFLPVLLSIAPDLAHYHASPLPDGLYTFGAFITLKNAGFSEMGARLAAVAILAAAGGWFVWRARLGSAVVRPGLQSEYLLFILGAALLTGSFIYTVNYAYRWVYAIWLVPFLFHVEVPAAARLVRQWLVATRWLLILALLGQMAGTLLLNLLLQPIPEEAIASWEDLINGLAQPVCWLLFACLSGWLAHFVVAQLRISPLPAGADA